MDPSPENIETFRQRLAATPTRIETAVNPFDSGRLARKPDEKSWSAVEILAHLRACADVWGQTINAMLAQDNPTLSHISPRTWVNKTNYLQLPFDESFAAFTRQRQELLRRLEGLPPADWSRGALIKGWRHTVFSQVRRMATHENEHCAQLEALLK